MTEKKAREPLGPPTVPKALAVSVLVAGGAGLVFWLLGTVGGISGITEMIRDMAPPSPKPSGGAAVVVAAATFTFFTVFLPFPAEAAALLNGTLFSPFSAFMLTWSMGMLGATASYEIGRRYGRQPASRLVGKPRIDSVERLVERAGWPTLLALRLSPVTAFTAINWASGILGLSRPVFLWTTAAGLIPGTYIFSYLPELLRNGKDASIMIVAGFAVVAVLLTISFFRLRSS